MFFQRQQRGRRLERAKKRSLARSSPRTQIGGDIDRMRAGDRDARDYVDELHCRVWALVGGGPAVRYFGRGGYVRRHQEPILIGSDGAGAPVKMQLRNADRNPAIQLTRLS